MLQGKPGGAAQPFRQLAVILNTASIKLDEAHEPLLHTLGIRVMDWAKIDFRDRGTAGKESVDGTKWKELAESTIRRKQAKAAALAYAKKKTTKKGTTRPAATEVKIGVDDGYLIASLNFGGPSNFFKMEPLSVSLGTLIDYSGWFNEVRPIFPQSMITPARRDILEATVLRFAAKSLEELGAGPPT